MPLLGDERLGWRVEEQEPHRELPRRTGGQGPVGAEHLGSPVERPGDQAADDVRSDLVEAEAEAGHDADVRPRPAYRPEEVRVLVARRATQHAVGRDDLDLDQVVRGPAEPAAEVAQPAAERQTRDADVRDEAEHRRESVLLGGLVHVPEAAPRADVRDPAHGVDGDLRHPRHVEQQASVGDRGAGDVVPPALDSEQQPTVARERHDGRHVGGGNGLDDQGGDRLHHAVPEPDGVVPARVARAQDRAVDRGRERVDLRRTDGDVPAGGGGVVDGGVVDGGVVDGCVPARAAAPGEVIGHGARSSCSSRISPNVRRSPCAPHRSVGPVGRGDGWAVLPMAAGSRAHARSCS